MQSLLSFPEKSVPRLRLIPPFTPPVVFHEFLTEPHAAQSLPCRPGVSHECERLVGLGLGLLSASRTWLNSARVPCWKTSRNQNPIGGSDSNVEKSTTFTVGVVQKCAEGGARENDSMRPH